MNLVEARDAYAAAIEALPDDALKKPGLASVRVAGKDGEPGRAYGIRALDLGNAVVVWTLLLEDAVAAARLGRIRSGELAVTHLPCPGAGGRAEAVDYPRDAPHTRGAWKALSEAAANLVMVILGHRCPERQAMDW